MVIRLFKEEPDSNIQLSSTYALQLNMSEVRTKQVLFTKVVSIKSNCTASHQITQFEDLKLLQKHAYLSNTRQSQTLRHNYPCRALHLKLC